MVMELLDEDTLEPITDAGKEGVLITTNLTRSLMPIIRYPTGDRGVWVEPNKKFRLLGRSEEAARVGLVKLYVQDVRDALSSLREKCGVLDFQLFVDHHSRLDGLTVRIATAHPIKEAASFSGAVIAEIHRARPLYEEFVRDAKVHPIAVEWVEAGGLETNSRTGKMRRVIDRRFDQ
jgi:phenylacetate-CoA ligase